jgi:glycosyltransferase involved in cell wall biosynthesis
VERLPARIELLCDTWLTRDGSGRRAGPPPWVRRALRGVRRLTGLPLDECLRRRAFARFLRQRGIDVVLAEFGPAGALLAGACEAAGVPLVVHFHGYDAYRETIIRTWGGAYRRMFGKAAAVIAVSHAMEQQLAGLGALPDRIRYNPYGVDCALFQPTDPEANPPLFVAVGRFVTKKAPNLTIRAFARARESCGDCRLTMAGNGPLLEQCRDLARDLGVGDAIEFTGSLPHAEVAALMARGRAFVQHSVTAPDGDAEGTPVAILEAGAVGLPVVATRHAGIPDVVVEGENGLLVDEGDVEAMAAHMLSLARDPALAGRLGRAARERVSTRFSMERSIGRLHEILLEAGGR